MFGWADPDGAPNLSLRDALELPAEPSGVVTAVGVTGLYALVAQASSLVALPLKSRGAETASREEPVGGGALPDGKGLPPAVQIHRLPMSRGSITGRVSA